MVALKTVVAAVAAAASSSVAVKVSAVGRWVDHMGREPIVREMAGSAGRVTVGCTAAMDMSRSVHWSCRELAGRLPFGLAASLQLVSAPQGTYSPAVRRVTVETWASCTGRFPCRPVAGSSCPGVLVG